jgi:hypothetical protein
MPLTVKSHLYMTSKLSDEHRNVSHIVLLTLLLRGECVSRLEALTGFDSWVLGYQKVVPVGWMNIMRWWSDTK